MITEKQLFFYSKIVNYYYEKDLLLLRNSLITTQNSFIFTQ